MCLITICAAVCEMGLCQAFDTVSKHDLNSGSSLPVTATWPPGNSSTCTQVVRALEIAGFVVDEVRDLALESDIPWYGESR